jgi:acetyl esterase
MARRLVDDGYVVILPDYRVRCRDGSDIEDAVTDAKAAYAWVQQHADELRIDANRVAIGGESAGGQLALMATLDRQTNPRPFALLLFNPVVDLVELSSQLWIDQATARRLSPVAQPLDALPPSLILHGTADTRISIQSVRRFCKAGTAVGRLCQLQEYRGLDHGFFHSRTASQDGAAPPFDDALQRVRRFLAEQAEAPADRQSR